VLFLKSIVLAVIQGITEFLPLSSSGHLKLMKIFFNENFDDLYLFDLFCHLGTTIAIMVFLRKEIKNILKDKIYMGLIFLAILPLFPIYFLLTSFRDFFSQTYFLPLFLFLTSLILFLCSNLKIQQKDILSYKKKIKDVLLIGTMQALALIPGLSRCGWTISSAYFRGWNIKEAVKFSFLLAIPTVFGGSFLQTIKFFHENPIIFNFSIFISYLTGFIISFFVGYFSIRYIFSITSNKKLYPFAWYLLILSIFSFIYLDILK